MNIKVDDNLKKKCNINLACFFYKTNVFLNEELWNYIDSYVINNIKSNYSLENLCEQVNIKSSREAYKNLGKEPSRYRVSSEALIRRILQGKDLYKINNIVDTNNLISIETGYSVGSYDLDQIKGEVVFRIGYKDEKYQGIGKDIINIENLPVFSDNIGAFGSPTSDSTRTMIKNESKNILTVIISFNGTNNLDDAIKIAEKYLIKYANAKEIKHVII